MSPRYLARQAQKNSIQFHEVCINAVKAAAPLAARFFRSEFEDREIATVSRILRQVGKLLAKISEPLGIRQMLAIFARKYGAEHALIL
jgi:hypothetical protein